MQRFIFFILLSLSYLAKAQENNFSKSTTTFTIEYPQLKTTQKVWVYLPKSYSLKNKKFAVLYVIEGQNLFDSKKTTNWNIDEMLTRLRDNVILVGIATENNNSNETIIDFITTILKPKIDQQFHTKKDAYNTAIIGSADNGLIAFNAALEHQKIFGKAAVLFPTVAENDSIYNEILKEKKLNSKIFLFGNGSENGKMAKNLNKMEYSLNSNRCYCLNLTKVFISKEEQ